MGQPALKPKWTPGARNLITDVDGILVGQAADPALKSGVTVVTSGAPFTASVAVQGGAPGTRETDLLAPDKTVAAVDALVLSGGSAFGLSAADGVVSALRAAGRGFEAAGHKVPIVPAAILFDLTAGGDQGWSASPYPALGRAAFEGAARDMELGSAGAGTGATTATLKGGVGSASLVLPSGHTVGALIAANPVGSVCGPKGHFHGQSAEFEGEFGNRGPDPELRHTELPVTKLTPGTATTIGIVATDAALDKAALHRLAVSAHDGIARAIVPAHTPFDGDLIFSVSTGARPVKDPVLDPMLLGHAAALCVARAIGRAVYEATAAEGDTLPVWSETFA